MAQTETATGTIVGYFEDHAQAARAVEALQDAGFSSAHLGVAYRGGAGSSSSMNTGTSAGTLGTSTRTDQTRTGDPESGVWGKIRNFFGADESEPYADERTQGSFANREITANPADSYAAGQDDFHNNLKGLDVPEDRSRYFGHRFENSDEGAVVTVNAGTRGDEAMTILTRYGADLGENANSYQYPQSVGSVAASADTQTTPQNIQLLGEVLRVHKDRVSRGEVRLRKEVVTEMQTVQVPVTREELVIERRAVDGQQVQGTIGEGQEIRIPLTEEQASIDKATVVREEVSVGKKQVEETRNLESDVRHEELQVEDSTRPAGQR